jgi:adenosylcobyric acid synthase
MGTASDVGKSVVVTGLCRIFAHAGVRVAPFKAQNMSNNAAVCSAGGEIGRAQAVQAEACGLEPTVDMNPVLLKPESETGCQVVIRGRPRFRMTAREYQNYCVRVWPEIVGSYERLSAEFEVVVIEGAGGAAEINLRDRDVVNWPIARLAQAPVLIVADIDRGGALAALVGTVELLAPDERDRVKGLIINKFRGDQALLDDGLRIVEERTGIPILGVLPYAGELEIPQEDSASLKVETKADLERPIKVGVVRFPCISNHTDFEPLAHEVDVDLRYYEKPDADRLDLLCLPGSKTTIADLDWLRATGWDRYIADHHRAGGSIVGICGGYQMLGRVLADPDHVESAASESSGLGLLEIETVFEPDKVTALVDAVDLKSRFELSGYEIHCGRVTRLGGDAPFQIHQRQGRSVEDLEGAVSIDGRVLGTSIHGLFDAPEFRRHYLNQIRIRKRLAPLCPSFAEDSKAWRMREYERVANLLRTNLDISTIASLVGLSGLAASSRGHRTGV